MLKAAWLRCLIGAAFASLKKISFGFFSIPTSRDRTERGALCDNWQQPEITVANYAETQAGFIFKAITAIS